jgi:hypothetical protein
MTAAAAVRRGPLGSRSWVWLALGLYVLVASATVARHEMWRDETHAWQAVVAADSLMDLASNVRTEGHPGLWFAVLYPVSRVTSDPGAMQLVHLAIAIAVAAVVLLAAPLPIGWRVLFVAGYYPLYEYCAISRNYALGALLLFAFCALYGARIRRPLVLAAVLFLLAQASAVALILSFSLGVMWIADARSSRLEAPIRRGPALAALGVWLVGIVVSVAQLSGARVVLQSFDHHATLAQSRVLGVLAGPWRGCVPLPRLQLAFWNSNILDGVTHADVLQAVLGVVVLVVLGSLFVRCGPVLALFAVGSLGMVAFSLFIYRGHLRHHGHFLLLLMAALWLTRVLQPGAGGRGRAAGTVVGGTPLWGAVVVSVLLAANAAAGAYAVAREWRDPFSAAREVADFIRAQGLSGIPIVGHRDVQVAAVAAYLERPIHYPSLGREASFLPWKVGWRRPVDDAEAVREALDLAARHHSEVLVILSMSGASRPDRIDGATRLRVFRRSIVPSERFELYLVPRPEPAAPLSGSAPHPGPVPRG